MVLAIDVEPEILRKQILRRRKFLEKELAHERSTLQAVRSENSARGASIEWVIGLNIEQIESELRWLRKFNLRVPENVHRDGKIAQRKTA